jgi:hypothetical protein
LDRPDEIRDRSPLNDPEKAARKLVEIANSIEPAQEGRIFIELVNAPFLYEARNRDRSHSTAVQGLARHRATYERKRLKVSSGPSSANKKAAELPRRLRGVELITAARSDRRSKGSSARR